MPCHIDTPVRPVRAPRHDGWTPERARLFFETLAAGHSVVRACARAGLSRRSAYKARRRDPGFAHQWQAAQQSARRAATAAFLASLPENLRRAVLEASTECDLEGAEFFPLDCVTPVNRM